MLTSYLILGTFISLLLFCSVKALEHNNLTVKKLYFKKSQMIKFKKDEGE